MDQQGQLIALATAPVADADDLQTYLGADSIDSGRATALIAAAQSLAEAIVSPVPDDLAWVVVQAAARAYASPPGSGDVMLGSARVASYGKSSGEQGVYLTEAEDQVLRGGAGRSRAGWVDMLPSGWSLSDPFGDAS